MLIIKEILKEKGITMADLAVKLGISAPALSQRLSRNTTIEKLEEIASAIGVDVSDLFARPSNVTGYLEIDGKITKISCVKDIEDWLASHK